MSRSCARPGGRRGCHTRRWRTGGSSWFDVFQREVDPVCRVLEGAASQVQKHLIELGDFHPFDIVVIVGGDTHQIILRPHLHGSNDSCVIDAGYGVDARKLIILICDEWCANRCELPQRFHEGVLGSGSLEERLAKNGIPEQGNANFGGVERKLQLLAFANSANAGEGRSLVALCQLGCHSGCGGYPIGGVP